MEEKKKIIYVDMDGVLVDFESGIKKAEPDLLTFYKGQYDNIPHIFSWMDPMPGAIESFKALQEKYDVYILTTAPWKNETALQDKKFGMEIIKKIPERSRNGKGIYYSKISLTDYAKSLIPRNYRIEDFT